MCHKNKSVPLLFFNKYEKRDIFYMRKVIAITLLITFLSILSIPPKAEAGDDTEGDFKPEPKSPKRIDYVFENVINEQFVKMDNDELTQNINKIGKRLIASSNLETGYTFHIINEPLPNTFSGTGGDIYITTGLLDLLESKDELAAVLGHELGHLANRDQTQTFESERGKRAALFALGIIGGIAMGVATMGASGGSFWVTVIILPTAFYGQTQPIFSKIPASLEPMESPVFDGATMTLLSKACYEGYTEKQEAEADELAIKYLYKAGYNPNSMVSVLEKLSKKVAPTSHLLTAKPGLERRIENIKNLVDKIKTKGIKP